MGLASQFGGGQGYQCKNCGHTTALYAPRCPKCLGKSLSPVKAEGKSPEQFRQVETAQISEEQESGYPILPIAALAIILALIVAGSTLFAPPKPEATTIPDPVPSAAEVKARSQASASSSSASRSQPVRRSKPTSSRPAVSKAPGGSTGRSTPPKAVAPMKLWEASGDDEGGD